MKYKRTPGAVIAQPEPSCPRGAQRGGITRLDFWNETGKGREQLLDGDLRAARDRRLALLRGHRLEELGTCKSTATISGACRSAPSPNTTAARNASRACISGIAPSPLTVLVNVLVLCVLLYRQAFTASHDVIWWSLYAFAVLLLLLQGAPAEAPRRRSRHARRAAV